MSTKLQDRTTFVPDAEISRIRHDQEEARQAYAAAQTAARKTSQRLKLLEGHLQQDLDPVERMELSAEVTVQQAEGARLGEQLVELAEKVGSFENKALAARQRAEWLRHRDHYRSKFAALANAMVEHFEALESLVRQIRDLQDDAVETAFAIKGDHSTAVHGLHLPPKAWFLTGDGANPPVWRQWIRDLREAEFDVREPK